MCDDPRTSSKNCSGSFVKDFAVEQRAIFLRQTREGAYIKRQPRACAVTDLFKPYMVDFANRGGRNQRRWHLAWKHLQPVFGQVPVNEVTTARINEYISIRKAIGRSNGTVNRELTLLKAMFRFGAKQTPAMVERLPAFPARLKESAPRKGFVTDEQYKALGSNAKELWLRTLIACAYSFGFRKGEMLNLRVRQVDLLERWLELETDSTKNGEPRKVRMTTEVYELI